MTPRDISNRRTSPERTGGERGVLTMAASAAAALGFLLRLLTLSRRKEGGGGAAEDLYSAERKPAGVLLGF
jgi:hypothetical protein